MSREATARTEQRKRTTRYRERMRAAGLRPVQIWVPNTNAPSFAAKLRRQVSLLRGKSEERHAFDLIESIGDL